MPVSHVVVDDGWERSEACSTNDARFDTSSKSNESARYAARVSSIPPVGDSTLALDDALDAGKYKTDRRKVFAVAVRRLSHVIEDLASCLRSFHVRVWWIVGNRWVDGSAEQTDCATETVADNARHDRLEAATFHHALHRLFLVRFDRDWSLRSRDYYVLAVSKMIVNMKHVNFATINHSPVIISNEMPRHFIQFFIGKEYRSLRA